MFTSLLFSITNQKKKNKTSAVINLQLILSIGSCNYGTYYLPARLMAVMYVLKTLGVSHVSTCW